MTTPTRALALAGLLASAVFALPSAEARPGGAGGPGAHAGGPGWHGGPVAGGYRGGYRGGYGGGYRGGYYRGGWGYRGYWGPGPFWGGIGLGLGAGALIYSSGYAWPAYGYAGTYYADPIDGYVDAPVVVAPARAAVVAGEAPVVVRSGQPVPQQARAPEPIFYPRNGQSAAALETDRRECNRWAATQANALADASVFQRATYACMEGRGYTVK